MATWVQPSTGTTIFRCEKTNARLGTVFKILYFPLKKRITVWIQLWQFIFCCKKRMAETNGRLGTLITIIFFKASRLKQLTLRV